MVFVGIDSEFQKAVEADAKEDDWLIVSAYASIDVTGLRQHIKQAQKLVQVDALDLSL